jgi:hypothetical protein
VQTAVLPFEPVRGLELAHGLEKARRRERRLEREVVAQRFVVEYTRKALEAQERRQRGGERETTVGGVEQRLDAQPVARGEELAFPAVPDREGEDAIQAPHHVAAPGRVAAQDDFGVRARREARAARLELAAQRLEIVDLAVVDDDEAPVLVRHRLGAAGEVDHGEPGVAENRVVAAPESARVRPARTQGFERGFGARLPRGSDQAEDSAHVSLPPRSLPGTRSARPCAPR